MGVKLEVRVPISPTADFFRRVHFMAASLQRLESSIGPYRIVVCVGGDEEPRDLFAAQPWSANYPLVWHWADREAFRSHSFWETSHDIFRQPVEGRFVICADADVIFLRDFSELFGELTAKPAIAGVIAHGPPFPNKDVESKWVDLFRGYGVPPAAAVHQHTGWDFMTKARMTPVYYNFGMVIMPAAEMVALSEEMIAADSFVNARIETFFRFQIALTLAIQKRRLATRALPLRYNFPNDPRFDQAYPGELAQCRVLHYLRCEIIHRENDFASLPRVEDLLARRDLSGSNELLRRTVELLTPRIAAEESAELAPVT